MNDIYKSTIAGLVILLVAFISKLAYSKYRDWRDSKRVYLWFIKHSGIEMNQKTSWQSEIVANSINLASDRVRIICEQHPKIYLVENSRSPGKEWSILYKNSPGFFDVDWSE